MASTVHQGQKLKLDAAEMRLKNNRLGMTIFQISWIMVFLALIIVNWRPSIRCCPRPRPWRCC